MNLICGTVTEMCNGYQSVGRDITEYYFGFDRCQFFVLCMGKIRLIIVTDLTAQPDQVGVAGRQFMNQNAAHLEQLENAELTQRIKLPPPRKAPGGGAGKPNNAPEDAPEAPELWEDYREKLHLTLAKVLGSAQTTRLIDRVVKEHGYRRQQPLKTDFGSIGRAIVEKVPNRSRRRSLQSSVDEIARPK